ncbi:MAG TPA: hypothetical protein VMT63_04780 [Bacteroidales bacterium]|nr:hypothetical protein [Bacteroidales bacterium]
MKITIKPLKSGVIDLTEVDGLLISNIEEISNNETLTLHTIVFDNQNEDFIGIKKSFDTSRFSKAEIKNNNSKYPIIVHYITSSKDQIKMGDGDAFFTIL